jgi:hypothetical protein
MSDIEYLAQWFASQCNGDWEHGPGIRLLTADNPGWSLDIEIKGTELEGKTTETTHVERSDSDWIHARCDGLLFHVGCGVDSLAEALHLFRVFAEEGMNQG